MSQKPSSGGVVQTVDSVGNLVRGLASLLIAAIVGVAGFFGYNIYNANEIAIQERDEKIRENEREIASLKTDIEEKLKEIERLATAVRLLKVDRRLAHIELVKQEFEIPGDETTLRSTFNFVEVNDRGDPLEQPRQFTVHGDEIWIEAWVIAFEDEFVEKGDPLRGTSICLFRSVFTKGNRHPEEFPLEAIGSRPAAYSRGSEVSELERELWTNFWEYATNPKQAEEAGVRVANPQAVGARLTPNIRYRVELRASGGLSVAPEETGAPEPFPMPQ